MLRHIHTAKPHWNYLLILLFMLLLACTLDSQFEKGGMEANHQYILVMGVILACYLLPSQAKHITLAEKLVLPIVLAPFAFVLGLLFSGVLLYSASSLTGNSGFVDLEEAPTDVVLLADFLWYASTIIGYKVLTKAFRTLFYTDLRD
ncbi:hypothetical protein LRS06_19015 [Hymenobacter sp. J193]|uniref:hypothetical protein n=1 Tax=Hymenobacter sp. J193 TaxID=2898429 RepID=UPI002150CA57|nr:hypothetical protein [Hymenobacter sp. J193]MCR5889822.1 hypothetical protein [Hymenobacter sp. J193]